MKMVASLYRAVTEQYNEYMNSGDPRVTSWPLISGPTPMLVLIALYLIFVKLIGPAWMRNKKPFDLRYAMIIYNVALVCLNIYVVATMISILIGENKTLICRMDKDPYNPDAIKVAELGWLFYILKFVEFFDTIFFVLRKKDRNISALHVVHHSVTPIGTWISFRVVPGNYNYFQGLLNTVIHIVMYSYYALSAMGPKVQKYLFWKKYLTSLQIIQFIVMLLYPIILFMSNCEVSKYVIHANAFMAGLFLIMFSDFFYDSYMKKKSKNIFQTSIEQNGKNGTSKNDRHIATKTSLLLNGFNYDLTKTKTG